MPALETTLQRLEVFFAGATAFTALIFLFIVGQLLLGGESSSPAVVLGVAVIVVLCAFVVSAGMWSQRGWIRLASWPATLVLVVLGFLGTAIGPQIIGVAAFGLLASVVMTTRDYIERDTPPHSQAA